MDFLDSTSIRSASFSFRPIYIRDASASRQHPLIFPSILRYPMNLNASRSFKKFFGIQMLCDFLLKGYWVLTHKYKIIIN